MLKRFQSLRQRLFAAKAIRDVLSQLLAEGMWLQTICAPYPSASSHAKKFSGKYAHRIITGGIGNNLPQEVPQVFAQTVINVGGY
jgi:hypothetical protein